MSKKIVLILSILILAVHFLYYPKWKQFSTEATLSWDVSGYYMYLPAIFIYKDLKTCSFKEEILKKYRPSVVWDQSFEHEESGNQVMKYSIGQAIQFLPAFLIAHSWASISDSYLADGFSLPYQLLISMWSLLVAILGLYYLRKSLIHYFHELSTSIALVVVVLGSNYLNYSAIDGAMTHNVLFTIYALLIWSTIQFYKAPSISRAVFIGGLVGCAALIRPTEIITCLVPLAWGLNLLSLSAIKERLTFFKSHWNKYLTAILICLSIGSIQLIYWKYVTGGWVVYSYEDQGFSWLKPHIYNGLLSYKAGWLTYSPAMVFALIGFYALRKFKTLFPFVAFFASLFIYITFAWDIWWYGGSLGQRAMIQSYPILAFPLAAFTNSIFRSRLWLN